HGLFGYGVVEDNGIPHRILDAREVPGFYITLLSLRRGGGTVPVAPSNTPLNCVGQVSGFDRRAAAAITPCASILFYDLPGLVVSVVNDLPEPVTIELETLPGSADLDRTSRGLALQPVHPLA